MLIPSIDLMGGKIVQLVQGEKKALEFDNFDYWIERFSKYPLVQVIDLTLPEAVETIAQSLIGSCDSSTARWVAAFAVSSGAGGFRRGRVQNHLRVRAVAGRQDQHGIRCYAGKRTGHRSASVCPRFPRWTGGDRRLAQRDCGYRVRHDSGARTILRNVSLHSNRDGGVDGRNPDEDRVRNPASHFAAASGRRWRHDAARNRYPRRAGDGHRCRDGLIFRQAFGVNATRSRVGPLSGGSRAAPAARTIEKNLVSRSSSSLAVALDMTSSNIRDADPHSDFSTRTNN